MRELKLMTIHHMIVKESVIFIHKILFNYSPPSITDYMTFSLSNSDNVRLIRRPMIKKAHKSKVASQSLLYRAIYLYNKLPDHFRTYNVKKFTKTIGSYILENFANNSIPKNEPG